MVLIGKFKSNNVLKLTEKRPRLELPSGEFFKRCFAESVNVVLIHFAISFIAMLSFGSRGLITNKLINFTASV